MKRLTILVALAFAGCLQGSPSGDIPCDGDESCPTGFWCGEVGSCSELTSSSPPVLELVGVAQSDDGPFQSEISVPAGTVSGFELKLQNTGGSEAVYPSITLQGPDCLGVDSAYFNAIIQPGEAGTADVEIDPDASCTGPASVEVTMALDTPGATQHFTRSFTGSFTVNLTPAP